MRIRHALDSSIGAKLLVALTGLGLAGFLITHLAGNLLFMVGPEAFNRYSHSLVSNPLIYLAEGGLLVVFLAHIVKAIGTVLRNRAARPESYAVRRWARTKSERSRKTLASSTMIVTGTIILLFIVTHLLTFKFGPVYETPDGVRDLYRLQLEVFRSPLYVVFYLVAMSIIFFHLWHGVSSTVQSLGVSNPVWGRRLFVAGRTLALVLAAGFAVLPVYTFFVAQGL